MNKPENKPQTPYFSSGPTRKHPGWALSALHNAHLGQSHRSPAGQAKLRQVITLTRDILAIPANYRVAIIPGSATGAMECALWNLLGARGVDVFAWDFFGDLWATDVLQELKLADTRLYTAPSGYLPDLFTHEPARDVVFTWNGTTSGVSIPHLDWISGERQGLSLCDATSAAFCTFMEWSKLDVTAFSWQKGLGGEGAHGMLVLSPRAVDRLTCYTPPWPIPRLFRLTQNHQVREEIFQGATLNTPSLLCVEDCLDALLWAQESGGLAALVQRCERNFDAITQWVRRTPWIDFLAKDPATHSKSSVCLEFIDKAGNVLIEDAHRTLIQSIEMYLLQEEVALDIRNHRSASPSLRLWTGPTIETSDLHTLFPWIEWAYSNSVQG